MAWYQNFDTVVHAFSLITAFVIAAISFRSYLLTKQRKQEYFSAAFLFIAAGMLLAAVLNYFIQFEAVSVPIRGYIQLTFVQTLFLLGNMFLILAGYMTIFIINEGLKSRKTIFLLYMLIALSVVVAHEFYIIYHIVLFTILALIFNHYYWNYIEQHTANRLLVMLSFASILLAQILFVFLIYNALFYTLGHVLVFLGFVLLLAALVKIYA